MSTPALLRSRVAGLTALAERDLAARWRTVTDAAQARIALNDVLPALVETYGLAAAAVAAEWYDDARETAGVGGHFTGIAAELPDPGVPGLVAWAASEATSLDMMLPLVVGGVQKRIANAARGTVIESALADPHSDGWQRHARAGGCYFCRMLAGRGAVYTEATVDFASHDHCGCVAVSAWSGQERPVKPFTPSPRSVSAADKRRAERWIEDHRDELDAVGGGGVSAGGSGGTGGGTPFPKDQNGDDVPFAREDVEEWPDTWEHVWLGTPVDPGQGRHDPFHPPPVIDKTLFPKRWFGSSRDHQQAEAEIMAALHAADLIVERQGEGAWRMEGTHDGVRTVHIVKHKAGVPVLDAAWPKHGPGVGRVVATDPITVRWLT